MNLPSRPPVLVFGREGQLARSLRLELPHAQFISSRDCDFRKLDRLEHVLDDLAPKQVLIASAFTQVDLAESEREVALTVNAKAPQVIANWCAKNKASIVYFSTDYIYGDQGREPLSETSKAQPTNYYGATKLEGENLVRASGAHHLILRTSWLFSPWGQNFVKTMVKLGREQEIINVVSDQVGAPTYAPDLALATRQILDHPRFEKFCGILNVVNSGEVSWFEFAKTIFEELNLRNESLKVKQVKAISSDELQRPAQRPLNSRLNVEKLKTEFGIELRPWSEALRQCLKQIP